VFGTLLTTPHPHPFSSQRRVPLPIMPDKIYQQSGIGASLSERRGNEGEAYEGLLGLLQKVSNTYGQEPGAR
jgi:hypothetical protein